MTDLQITSTETALLNQEVTLVPSPLSLGITIPRETKKPAQHGSDQITSNVVRTKIDKKIVSAKEVNQPKEIESRSAPKRPEWLPCEIHRSKIGGEDWIIFVGVMNGRPYEVFGGQSDTIEIPKKYTEGKIKKRSFKSGGKYDLFLGEGDDELKIKNFVHVFDNPNYSAFTRLLSLSLRHGAPIQYVVEQLLRDRDADLFSFSKVMARVLKKHIEDGTHVNGACPSCGSNRINYQGGCPHCMDCEWSQCD